MQLSEYTLSTRAPSRRTMGLGNDTSCHVPASNKLKRDGRSQDKCIVAGTRIRRDLCIEVMRKQDKKNRTCTVVGPSNTSNNVMSKTSKEDPPWCYCESFDFVSSRTVGEPPNQNTKNMESKRIHRLCWAHTTWNMNPPDP